MTEALIVIVPVVVVAAALIVSVVTQLRMRLDNCERMCLELHGSLADLRYSSGHPAYRSRRISPEDPYDPFDDEGVLG